MTQGRQPTPKLSRRGRILFGWIAGAILAATLSLHFWYFPRFRNPVDSGLPTSTEGRVTARTMLSPRDGQPVVRITYRFRAPGGAEVEGHHTGPEDRFGDLHPGDRVRILYSRSNPMDNRLPEPPGVEADGDTGRLKARN